MEFSLKFSFKATEMMKIDVLDLEESNVASSKNDPEECRPVWEHLMDLKVFVKMETKLFFLLFFDFFMGSLNHDMSTIWWFSAWDGCRVLQQTHLFSVSCVCFYRNNLAPQAVLLFYLLMVLLHQCVPLWPCWPHSLLWRHTFTVTSLFQLIQRINVENTHASAWLFV